MLGRSHTVSNSTMEADHEESNAGESPSNKDSEVAKDHTNANAGSMFDGLLAAIGQQDEDLDTKVKPLLQKASNEAAAELLSEQANKLVLDIDTPTKPACPDAELLIKPAHESIVVDTPIQHHKALV